MVASMKQKQIKIGNYVLIVNRLDSYRIDVQNGGKTVGTYFSYSREDALKIINQLIAMIQASINGKPVDLKRFNKLFYVTNI